MLQPVLQKLTKKGHEVVVQTKMEDALLNSPWKTLPYDSVINPNDYDEVFDMDGAVEPKSILKKGQITDEEYATKSRIDIWQELFDMTPVANPETNWWVSQDESEIIDKLLRSYTRPIVVYISNSTSPYRTYPLPLGMAVCKELNQDYDVVWAGDHGNWAGNHWWLRDRTQLLKDNSILDLSEFLGIRLLAALINRASLVITSDTGPLHIAAALKIPTIGLFGNIDPSTRVNYYPTVAPLWKKMDCFCGDRIKGSNCPDMNAIESIHRAIGATCMWRLSPSEIVSKARLMLSNASPRDFIRFHLSQWFRGVGGTSGEEFLFNSNELKLGEVIGPQLDWIYSGWLSHTQGDERIQNKIPQWKQKLKPGGYLIIHESIAPIWQKTNQTKNKHQCLRTVSQMMKMKVVYAEQLIHNNSFVVVGQKEIE